MVEGTVELNEFRFDCFAPKMPERGAEVAPLGCVWDERVRFADKRPKKAVFPKTDRFFEP